MTPRPRKVVQIPVYWVVVCLFMVGGSMIGIPLVSVKIANKNSERIFAQQEAAKAQARLESRAVICSFFASSLDVYLEVPPVSPAGRAQQRNYLDLYTISGCQPPRKE